MSEQRLIVGLGNPGKKYQNTRHNIGFQCLDELARLHGLSFDKRQAKAKVTSGIINNQKVLLAKPQTFMNLSGEAVGKLANFYKIPTENIIVIFDDLDLPLGTIRLRKSGGTGGHKGMKSIVQHLGTQDFPRIRFGIGRPPGRMDPAAYVLLPFSTDEAILVTEIIDRVMRAVETWLSQGVEHAMNYHNGSAEDVEQRQHPAAETQSDTKPTA